MRQFKIGDMVRVKKNYKTGGCEAFHEDAKLYQSLTVKIVDITIEGAIVKTLNQDYDAWSFDLDDLIHVRRSMENK